MAGKDFTERLPAPGSRGSSANPCRQGCSAMSLDVAVGEIRRAAAGSVLPDGAVPVPRARGDAGLCGMPNAERLVPRNGIAGLRVPLPGHGARPGRC